MPQYSWDGQIWEEDEVIKAAQAKDMSLAEYMQEYNVTAVEETKKEKVVLNDNKYSLTEKVDDPLTLDRDESLSYEDFLVQQKNKNEERQLIDYETWVTTLELNDPLLKRIDPSGKNATLANPADRREMITNVQDAFNFLSTGASNLFSMITLQDTEKLTSDIDARKRKLRNDRQIAYEAFLNEFNPDFTPSYLKVDEELRLKIDADPNKYIRDNGQVGVFGDNFNTGVIAGISNKDLSSMFGEELNNDEIARFADWYNGRKGSDYRERQKMGFLTTKSVEKGDGKQENRFKADVMSSYLAYRSEVFDNDLAIYKKNGIPELVDDLNRLDSGTEELIKERNEKNTKLEEMYASFENGTLEQNEKNINAFNGLRVDILSLDENYKVLMDGANIKLSPHTRKLLDGYFKLSDEASSQKALRIKFLTETDFGKQLDKKIQSQIQTDDHYSKYGEIGIRESAASVANTFVNYFAGGSAVLNVALAKVKSGINPEKSKEYKTNALLLNDVIEKTVSEYGNFALSSTPFIDPESGDVNLSRLLPSLSKTVADMYLMSKGSKSSYRVLSKVGAMTKRGMLKVGVKPGSLKNASSFYKSGVSMASTGIGSLPVLLPQNLSSALSAVNDDFTAEDAFDYALKTTVVESAIEMVNPDFKFLKRGISNFKKAIKNPSTLVDDAIKTLKREPMLILQQALKGVSLELTEEYLQMFSKGAIDMSYNNAYNTDFKLPEANEIKETFILTSLSVLAMRGLSGNLRKVDRTSIYRSVSDGKNYDAFLKELDNQVEKGEISLEKSEKIREELDGYILIKGDIDELLFNKDGSVKVTEQRADELIELLTQRNELQNNIDKDDALVDDYKKQLDDVNSQISNMKNTIEFDSSLREVVVAEKKIKDIQEKLKDTEISQQKREELNKEITKLKAQQEESLLRTPEYSIDGKTYKTKEEFLKRIRAHRQNGDFKRGKVLNIKVKNDFTLEKEAYKIMGKYAPKESQERVVMSNAKSIKIVEFINNRSQSSIEQELNEEESKENKDLKKIQQLKDALKYFELKRANYKFGTKGFLVPKITSKAEDAQKRLDKSIAFVEKYGEEIGGKTKTIKTEKKFNALMKKLGIKGAENTDGVFDPNTKTFYINKEVAEKYGAVNVGSHELLHGILWSTLNGPLRKVKDPSGNEVDVNITEEGLKLVKGFIEIIKQNSNFNVVQERIDNNYRYNKDGSEKALEEYAEEYVNVFTDALRPKRGQPSIKFEESSFRKIINLFKNFFKPKGFVNLEFKDGRALYDFLKAYDQDRVSGNLRKSIVDFGKKSSKKLDKVKGEKVKSKSDSKTPEQLVKIIQRGQNPQRVKEAYESLTPQFDLLALKALNYDTRKGDIDRESVIAEARKFLPGIVKRFNPKDSKFSTFVTANMRPKQAQIYEATKTQQDRTAKKLDSPDVKELAGDVNTTTNTENVFVEKIDVLGFATVARVADKIKALVKVKPGDTFKQIIQNYAGKVGSLVFDIPAKKIMEGGANLAAVTKYTEGMPAPAEAQNIQKFFNAANNAERFIKILPPTNVTSKTADIDKRGENIDVSRDAYGLAIGLKGLPLEYFYEKTGKRSQGLTSQTPVFKLKDKFKNPTPEVIEQFKKDIGVTPKGEANVYSRNIGQLLKGVAKVYSINTALSAAQRVQEAKTKVAPADKQKAIKQQTADITTAQSKAAFSSSSNFVSNSVKQNYLENLLKEKNLGYTTIPRDKILLEIQNDAGVFVGQVIDKKQMQALVPGKDITWEKFLINRLSNFINTNPQYYNIIQENFTGGIKRGAFASKKLFEKAIPKTIQVKKTKQVVAERNFYNKASKKGETGKRQKEDIKKQNTSIDDNKVENLINFFEDISKYLQQKENENDAWIFVEMALHGSIDQNKFGRKSAPFIGYAIDQNGNVILNMAVVEEHSPQAEMIRILTAAAIENKVKEIAPVIKYTFSQISILQTDDPNGKLKSSMGEDFYNKVVPLILGNKLPWLTKNYAGIYRLMKHGIDPNSYVLIKENKTIAEYFNVDNLSPNDARVKIIETFEGATFPVKASFSKNVYKRNSLSKAINVSRSVSKPRGITVLDFDDTLATSKSLVKYTGKNNEKGTLTPEQYASSYQDMQDLGYTFDFSEFNKVVDGKIAPLFQKALKLQSKFGNNDMFVLTARPAESAPAIFAFLKANGLNIPLKNITGLANSTSEAKALWMADKVSEGYNDFYFADDAMQNVQAVKNMLDQFDVKSKVQQAKVKFSSSMNNKFNNILEDVVGIDSKKRFDFIKGRKRGAGKGKFRLFIPPSHEDFVGLLYNFIGRGRKGDAHREFLEQALVRPLNRANKEYDTARQSVATDYKNLNKQMPDIKKKLIKKTPDGDFTYQDAIRVYLWDKHGYKIPGLSEIDQKKLVDLIKSDGALQSYADTINIISKQDKYVNPTDGWDSGDIRMDLDDATGRIGRAEFFAEFSENADVIFSTENLNKIEAGYGKGVREALEDMLYRIKTGRNKPTGQSGMVNTLMNWLNGSVGSVMFFNMRSALLQQMSIVNYINFADNNIFMAAKAFANQKQYWKDWAFIFNSDMLKQRRGGIMTDVNGAELAADMRKSKNPHRFLISKLLELGFLPTQIGDNIAIATGGAMYYRNRINSYLKQGLSQKEAEAKAFTDFQDITQSTQQSARPDMVSQQQASVIGKVILNFQNVTSQFNRLGKKAFQDIYNRRITKPNSTQLQSDISNAARITYYFAVQNAIFYTLQTALFAMMFDDDEEDVNNLFLKKKERLINGSIDSVLRGTGLYGSVVATLKNVAIAFARQRDINYNPDESAVVVEALNLSPVLGIKARKIVNAEKTLNYNKKVMKEMETFDIDNPQWSAVTNYVEGFTNLPLNRLYNKTQNIRQGLNNDHANWERTLMFLGWSQYNLNVTNEKMDAIKKKISSKGQKSKKAQYR